MKTQQRKILKKIHHFTLQYLNDREITSDVADAIFEAGCGDALLGVQEGVIFLDFGREAETFRDALLSAITDVERSGVGLRLTGVETARDE